MVSGGGCPFAETVQVVDQYCNYFHKPADGAFGEALVSQLSPAFQLDGLYGLDEFEFRLNSANGGLNYVSNDGLMTVESGTTSGAFSTLRSLRSVRYRPGQGSICRITAMFPTGFTEGYQQVAGFINQSDILGVGYNFGDPSEPLSKRDEFAIVRRQNSKGEVAQFTIDVAASGAETVTITLNNVAFPVSVTAGTTEENTAQLGNDSYTGWIVDYYGSELFFTYDGPPTDLTGTFSISSTGTLSGTYTNLQNGMLPNDNWTYQSDFNIDKLDGSGPSSMSIDPSKLNVFVIDFRWLGAGRIRYSIEDPATGCIFPFHMDYYANQNIIPSISNPSLRIGYGVANAAPAIGTGENVIVQGASMMGAIEGKVVRNTTTRSINVTIPNNLSANDEHHIITLKNNRIVIEGKPNVLNQRELILSSISASVNSTGGSDPIKVIIYKNATFDTPFTYEPINTFGAFSTTTALANANQKNKVIGSFYISPDQSQTIDLTPLRIIMVPLDKISVVTTSPQTTRGTGVSINFEVE